MLRSSISALHAEVASVGASVLVGVSGGQDSLCLVHALWRLQGAHGWALHVVHVEHGIRPEAAAEADYVRESCRAWGLPVVIVRTDVPRYRTRQRLNLQEAARYVRYQAFARQVELTGAAGVMVAHTADDVAETLLLHLVRGAGLDGLAAMPLAQTLPAPALGPPLDGAPLPAGLLVLRPLLAVARADTAAYCPEQGLQPVAEPPGHYRRERVRHDLLPALEAYNPAVRRGLAATAVSLAEDRAALDAWAVRVLDRLSDQDDRLAIPLAEWRQLPVSVQKRLLRAAAASVGGAEARLGRRHLAAALWLADGQAGRGIDLPAGLRLEREPWALCLRRGERPAETPEGPWELSVPGAVAIPGIGTLRAERCSLPEPLPRTARTECWLDAIAAPSPLTVRWRQPGDRFQPLGMSQEKRLQDFLVDAKVPRGARDQLPIVVTGGQIAWVVGQRIAEWARVREDSDSALHLVFEPAPGKESLGWERDTRGA